MKKQLYLVPGIIAVIISISIKPLISLLTDEAGGALLILYNHSHVLVIISIAWLLVVVIRKLKKLFLRRFDLSQADNLASRKVYTQVNLLEKTIIFIVILFSIGLVLLSFESIREIGVGLFATAGVAGIIIGLSAQKVVGTLLAGIQIAITQPFRIDDAVLVENEWGWIEEINLSYVVVRIWDKRRLVLPTTYFLEKPFQNWTRTSADIIGSVFIYTDYTISFEALRNELSRLLNESDLWDKNVNSLQVTDSKEFSVEIRILVSAKNSPTAWDLRVYIREKMIEFIQKNYPECLPRTRVALETDSRRNS
jgi:small-conductance mechanosensitive channel